MVHTRYCPKMVLGHLEPETGSSRIDFETGSSIPKSQFDDFGFQNPKFKHSKSMRLPRIYLIEYQAKTPRESANTQRESGHSNSLLTQAPSCHGSVSTAMCIRVNRPAAIKRVTGHTHTRKHRRKQAPEICVCVQTDRRTDRQPARQTDRRIDRHGKRDGETSD